MQYYRCKCGKSESWSSMGPTPCFKCDTCGSDLARDPSIHREPEPHNFVTGQVETDEGAKPLTRCTFCLKTKAQIESAERPEGK